MANDLCINELLSYASFYLNNSNLSNIKKIISNFYDSEDILVAKRLLWKISGTKLDAFSERKTTITRTSSEANINDIFEALQKLDSIECIPNFVAKDLNRVPDRQPEEINLVSILNRIATLEKNNKIYEDTLSNHEIDLQYLKTLEIENNIRKLGDDKKKTDDDLTDIHEKVNKIDDNEKRIIDIQNKIVLYENEIKTKTILPTEDSVIDSSSVNESDWESIESPSENPKLNVYRNVLHKLKKVYNKPKSRKKRKLLKSKKDPKNSSRINNNLVASSVPELSNNTVDFQRSLAVKYCEERQRNFDSSPHLLQGARIPPLGIFLSRVEYGNEDSVERYLRIRGIIPNKVEIVSHPASKFRSFKILIRRNHINTLLSEDFWPDNMKCRLWKETQGTNNTSKSRRVEFLALTKAQ